MGNPVMKEKHERRIGQKNRHINRQVKIAKANGMKVEEPHRFAKHNALDCGIPRCPVCNPLPKRVLTLQELRSIDSGKIDYD